MSCDSSVFSKEPMHVIYFLYVTSAVFFYSNVVVINVHSVSKNCAKLFLSELCQISTDCENFLAQR